MHSEVRLARATQPLTDTWRSVPVEPRGATLLGISFRPRQVEAFGLDPRATFETLVTYPLDLVRLGAYWSHIEPEPGRFIPDELDWQVEAAEKAGIRIIVCLGPLKTFGYPEFFPPPHYLPRPFPERTRIKPEAYPALLSAACTFISRLVERYRHHTAIVAWQLEHEAVDPLGLEHSWRLDFSFVEQEVEALRRADTTRPIIMNGFLPTSAPLRLSQWWQTRDQGDSLAVAMRLADTVGIDYYPCNAVVKLGNRTLYLDGSQTQLVRGRGQQLSRWAAMSSHRVMVTEGQAEPWETSTTPPDPGPQHGLYSCLPDHLIRNYNSAIRWSRPGAELYAYLFWGAEYWVLRKLHHDTRYLDTFARVLDQR